MKCSEFKEFLSAYANNELTPLQKEFVEEHLEHCNDCRAALEDYRVIRQQLESLQVLPKTINSVITQIPQIPHNKKRSKLRSFLIPQTRLAWILLPFIILLAGGTVYAATTIVKGLFNQYAEQIENAGLAQVMDINKTIDGVTVSLERAYADSNAVIVGYSINGPKNNYFAIPAKLSTDDGNLLQGMIGFNIVEDSDMILGDWRPGEHAAVLMSYDASSIEGTPKEINLHLEVNVDINIEISTLTGETDGNSVGPFIFNFTVPFHGGKNIVLNQTVETSGYAITLERAVITPWATRIELQTQPTGDISNDKTEPPVTVTTNSITIMFPEGTDLGNFYNDSDSITVSFPGNVGEVTLTLPNGQVYSSGFSNGNPPDNDFTTMYFEGDFTGQSGEWTLEISELVFPITIQVFNTDKNGNNTAAGEQKRLTGPWVFRFQVP
ncbi:MAG: zf-HC2 domain-containing protein [Dehalococcoidales bacterium]|nr:zf-HC2 domain-containing protein [Dehalococcoidales bacterium]